MDQLRNLIPPRLRAGGDNFLAGSDAVLGRRYLRGQLLVMLVMAVFYSVGLSLFGLEMALPIGLFSGLAMFCAHVGFGLGLVLAAFAGLLEFSATVGMARAVVMVAVVYDGGQVLEVFLTPRLVGETYWPASAGGQFCLAGVWANSGFVGVLVALPLSAILLVAIQRAKLAICRSRLFKG
ncbi:AI-2E family transporter [Candidatus Aalborgicola defluviihabitans]|uniref:AI-2E family transporter n=1 Tax=Candidatus Aalborgicola defluviihabitans TaxID=3386187 RepID=UPI0039B87DF6